MLCKLNLTLGGIYHLAITLLLQFFSILVFTFSIIYSENFGDSRQSLHWFSQQPAKQPYGRSSRRRCSVRKGIFKNFTEFTWTHLCKSFLFIRKRLWHRCFPVNFAKLLRIHFLQNTSEQLLLKWTTKQRD